MFNSTLAEQLRGLNLSPINLAPSPTAQNPRCICHNKYVAQCPANGVATVVLPSRSVEQVPSTQRKVRVVKA